LRRIAHAGEAAREAHVDHAIAAPASSRRPQISELDQNRLRTGGHSSLKKGTPDVGACYS